jgi:arsenate reductase (thioredoxin)
MQLLPAIIIGEGDMNKIRVLFLCTGNSARSQMAEAYLRLYGGDRFEAYSAGLEPAGINPLTKRVMDEVGVDISGQKSKSLTEYMGKLHFGYLITVCSNADKNCPVTFVGFAEREHWDIDDPAAFSGTEEQKLRKFREIRDQIKQKVQAWVNSHAT